MHAKNGKSLTFLIKAMMINGKNCLKEIRPKFAIFHQPQVIYWLNSQIGVVASFQKLGIIFRKQKDFKIDVINVNNKKCAPKLVFFDEKKLRKVRMIVDI